MHLRLFNVMKFYVIVRLYAKKTIGRIKFIKISSIMLSRKARYQSLSTRVFTPVQKLRPHKLSFKYRNINVLTL